MHVPGTLLSGEKAANDFTQKLHFIKEAKKKSEESGEASPF
jgi:hypothetical protein